MTTASASFEVTNQRNDTKFSVREGETVLDAALRQSHILPYGCRNGVCGACKCDLVDGTVDYGEFEESALSQAEIDAGKVLLCQAKPLENLRINAVQVAAEGNLRIRMLPCRVAKLNRLAQDVMQVFLQLPKSQEFNYLPGQYLDIITKDQQRRSFSIANLPDQSADDGLELHIRHVPDGHFTPRVFNALRERDLLRFEGPFGTYLLQSEPTQAMLMVAGGTGFAPIKALIAQALARNPDQRIHLFWGARDAQDLYLHQLAQTWARDFPNFAYTPVLSEGDDPNWRGARGFVHETVLAGYDAFGEFDAYASGPPVMIDALRDSLTAKGLSPERFFFDSFTYAPQI